MIRRNLKSLYNQVLVKHLFNKKLREECQSNYTRSIDIFIGYEIDKTQRRELNVFNKAPYTFFLCSWG